MRNRTINISILFLFIFLFSACSAVSTSQAQPVNLAGLNSESINGKLAVGILELSGTDQSITAQQAADLLVLWKGVKSLNASGTAASEEMTALYGQIQNVLTSDQAETIQAMSVTSTEISALMKQYGLQNGTTNSASTSSSQAASSTGVGPVGGGEMPAGDLGAGDPMMAAEGLPGSQTSSEAGAPQASRSTLAQADTNILFAETVIKLLQQIQNS